MASGQDRASPDGRQPGDPLVLPPVPGARGDEPDAAPAALPPTVPYLAELSCLALELRLGTNQPFGPKGDFASDLRGALGKALHGGPDYRRLFEPPLPERAPRGLGGGEGAPRPFVLTPLVPACLGPTGGAVRCRLTLLGRPALEPGPWLRALRAACKDGFGQPRARFRVLDAVEAPWRGVAEYAKARASDLVPDGRSARLRLVALTPMRLFSDGMPLIPSPCAVVNALLRRLQALAWIHGDARYEAPFEAWLDAAEAVERAADFAEEYRAVSGRRISFRQRCKVPLEGALATWEGRIPLALAVLLAAGELTGVGKATTSGMGCYRLDAAAPEPEGQFCGARPG